MIFELARGRKFIGEQKTIECLCLGTIGLIVAPWKFDVLNTSIIAREEFFLDDYKKVINREQYFLSFSNFV